MGIYKKSFAAIAAVVLFFWLAEWNVQEHGELRAKRAACMDLIHSDMALINAYRMEHNYDFPNRFSELFTSKTLARPNYDPAGRYFENGEWGRDYPSWDAMAAAIDSGKIEGGFHYLGAGLSNDADLYAVVLLSDSLPGENNQDMVTVGLADGESRQITGVAATALKREFARGTRPLILTH